MEESLFAMNFPGRDMGDEYYALNPMLIIPTDLKEMGNDNLLLKGKSGKIYRWSFKKGDVITTPYKTKDREDRAKLTGH